MAGARIPQKKPVQRRISLVFASVCRRVFLAGCAVAIVSTGAVRAEDRFITLASTTSTEQSGLFDYILPIFEKESRITVRVVAVGTGQALAIGARGDADALLVHDRVGEDKFVADGNGIDRRDVMFNDFVLVGPKADPAHVRGLKDAKEAVEAHCLGACRFRLAR
jgi:tungstate transport system substrate-binding protein